MNSQFNIISLFSGCGGSSLGYEMAGGKIALAVEQDDHAAEVYKANFPTTTIYHGDIKELSIDDCIKMAGIKVGELDILDGSPPCQGFSQAGKRSFVDARNQLYHEYARLLIGLQPKVFVMENVSGMVKGKMKIIFADCLRELKSCGYKVKVKLLNAMYFNVPQSRQRLIFIGVRNDLGIEPSFPIAENKIITASDAIYLVEDQGIPLTPEANKYWPLLKYGESASKYHPKRHFFGMIKVDPCKPSPTLTRSAKGSSVVHWNKRRALGNKERAALSSYPSSFKWIGSRSEIYDRIGNSVPPKFMEAIALHIKTNILNQQKQSVAI